MVFMKGQNMGKVEVDVKLWNYSDEVRGTRFEPIVCRALVDSGAVSMVLPETLARQLKLPLCGKHRVRYADMRTAVRDTVMGLRLEVAGRSMVATAIVEPDRTQILMGQIALEELDLLIDCKQQRLIPRPESPDMPMSEIERVA